MNTAASTTNLQANMAVHLMGDDEDTRQALVMLLGKDVAALPLSELVQVTQKRVDALEADLNTSGAFGMVELEHGMLTKLLAQLLGGAPTSTALH